jgi:hypothetical protein
VRNVPLALAHSRQSVERQSFNGQICLFAELSHNVEDFSAILHKHPIDEVSAMHALLHVRTPLQSQAQKVKLLIRR